MNLDDKQLDILRHMLGINMPAQPPKPYRNYYCAEYGNADLRQLETLGAVRKYSDSDGYEWYTCTAAGRDAAITSHKAIAWSKSKRVYSRYLSLCDVLPDLTFRQFLTDQQFADVRRNA